MEKVYHTQTRGNQTFVFVMHILLLLLEGITGFGGSEKTNILCFSRAGSRPYGCLMWAELSVFPGPDVVPLFKITAVGKQTMNKHMLDVTLQREMVERIW